MHPEIINTADDGTVGTWGHMWNTGICHFDETPVTLAQVRALLKFSVKYKRPARNLDEAMETICWRRRKALNCPRKMRNNFWNTPTVPTLMSPR